MHTCPSGSASSFFSFIVFIEICKYKLVEVEENMHCYYYNIILLSVESKEVECNMNRLLSVVLQVCFFKLNLLILWFAYLMVRDEFM